MAILYTFKGNPPDLLTPEVNIIILSDYVFWYLRMIHSLIFFFKISVW